MNINTTAMGDDFYTFVNKAWLENTDIPDDYNKWGTITKLQDETTLKLKKLIELQKYNQTNYNKIYILYNQLNNSKYRNDPRNFNIIIKIISVINSLTDYTKLFKYIIKLDLIFGLSLPINISIQSDLNDSNHQILYLIPGGLGLPDRDYYFLESKELIRTEYIQFITNYASLFGIILNAALIFDLEKILAEKTYTNIQNRDPYLLNNMTTYNKFIQDFPNLIFINQVFTKTNKQADKINITNPNYTILINDLISTININTWKQYFIFKILLEFHNYLNLEIEACYFNFYSTCISDIKYMKPQWKRTLAILDQNIGELIGKLYVNNYFNYESKQKALDIFNMVKNELAEYLLNNDWMEPSTKEKAINKLNKIKIKIGYPDIYEYNYDLLKIKDKYSLLQNIINIKKFNINYKINQLYEITNKDKWFMSAHLINAYYSSSYNEIVFPAGILQKPFFSIDQDIVKNLAGVGMIIGHEIIHGFDDQGGKFDEDGNLVNWWTQNDLIKYKQKVDMIKRQYDNYTIEGEHINGQLTLGENIADLGGVVLSLKALKKVLLQDPLSNNINSIQEFFIHYSKIWKSKGRKKDILLGLLTDPHSPTILRVNGVIRNIEEFYNVFNIQPKHKLYLHPSDRATIWM
jgi:putative endopeptidase